MVLHRRLVLQDFVSLFLFCAFLIADVASKGNKEVCGSKAFLGMLHCTDSQQAADGRVF